MATIRIIRSAELDGAWQGIYINGALYHQGRRLSDVVWENLLREFGHTVEAEEVSEEAMGEMGELPPAYQDVLRTATDQGKRVDLDAVTRR